MGFVVLIVGWVFVLMVAWPIALLVAILLPFFWLLSIPFRIVGIVVDAMLAFLKAVLFLPARILGHR
jgi:hypothetical protein